MVSNNIKWIGSIFIFISWTISIWFSAIHYQSTKDDVKSLKNANILLIQDKYNKDKVIDFLNKQIESNELANSRLQFERDTINAEYDHANSVIKKYQTKFNSRTFIDSSFVRYLEYTQQSKRLSESAAYAFIFAATPESATASGILSYINDFNKWGKECAAQNQAINEWYEDLYIKFNELNNARNENK